MNEIDFIVDTYGDMLYRICLVQLHSVADAEDALQETYLKYIKKHPNFDSEDHRRAWLIRVTVNQCRDMLRSIRIRTAEDIDTVIEKYADSGGVSVEDGMVLRSLMLLPEKYSSVMILHFVEGYDYKEIARIIGRSESAVKMRVKRGRELFIQIYKKENAE